MLSSLFHSKKKKIVVGATIGAYERENLDWR